MDELFNRLLKGDRRALAKAITLIENDDLEKYNLLKSIYSCQHHSYIIGVTGSPGSGKSTLVNKLIIRAREEQWSVGVLAIDPSSPFSGGALLGDRIRMQEHTLDPSIFIRSMGSRGALGGLSKATREACKVLNAFKKDIIILETVGVGQSEVDIVKYADTTLLVLTPAGGDGVQTIKAGVMEIADIFVVNKADFPGSDRTYSELEAMLELSNEKLRRPSIIKTIASEGQGIGELFTSILEHYLYIKNSGFLNEVRRKRIQRELVEQLENIICEHTWKKINNCIHLDDVVNEILHQRSDPYSSAKNLLNTYILPETDQLE